MLNKSIHLSPIFMRNILTVFVFALFVTPSFAQNQIVGKWLSQDKQAVTEIFERDGKYFGNINWLKNPADANGIPLKDTENNDKTKQGQPIMGLTVLKDLAFQNNEWKGGTAYDPKSGKSFSCKLWLDDNNNLKVRGYWGLFNHTETWTKSN